MTVATYPGPGFTYFARWIGRCPKCKAVVKIEETAEQTVSGWWIEHTRRRACPACGGHGILKMVMGTVSDRKCNATCQNAKGPSCDCSCGGENHGHLS